MNEARSGRNVLPPLDQLRAMSLSSGPTNQNGLRDTGADERDSGDSPAGGNCNTLGRRRRRCTVRIHLASCKYPVCESRVPSLIPNINTSQIDAFIAVHCTNAGFHCAAVREVREQLGWAEAEGDAAHVFWCDTSAGAERLARLTRPQKLNHFPGMLAIARKKGLARCLASMRCGVAQGRR